jgi:hypothetical protein
VSNLDWLSITHPSSLSDHVAEAFIWEVEGCDWVIQTRKLEGKH